ncbi:uncharacterized protein STEHIDRAFT_163509 [Stereum hirsutum FP-91666 SS1]|uniref:Uncharacterized protein n=1 Tax=Stereum hirsutum (strain FP-91666) TaxID=721885 RepID=R7RXR7_STEHR|nr:uncharacterized protein STEHIDRAFT_163509 [Stereum hirsutum FP-91666 SS1]EIM79685.1 hypothetical protein STEHIDRAFT_163509 [Stereum hirsutum FP-91666 SS1]
MLNLASPFSSRRDRRSLPPHIRRNASSLSSLEHTSIARTHDKRQTLTSTNHRPPPTTHHRKQQTTNIKPQPSYAPRTMEVDYYYHPDTFPSSSQLTGSQFVQRERERQTAPLQQDYIQWENSQPDKFAEDCDT